MPPADTGAEAGFTLIELTIVLVILALVAGLVLTRGAPRSPVLAMQQATTSVAGAYRLARSRAIASSRPIPVRFGADGATWQLGDDAPHMLPDRIRMVHGATVITFRPDGSASGGAVELADGPRRSTVEVNWMTGRVVVR